MIEFACPHCATRLRVGDDKAGRMGKCPSCGASVQVPAPPPAGREAEPAPAGPNLSGSLAGAHRPGPAPPPPPAGPPPAPLPPPGQVAAPARPAKNPGLGFGIAGMVLGLVSIVFMCLLTCVPYLSVLSLVPAVVGLILSVVGMRKSRAANAPAGMAVTGLVLCIVVLAIATTVVVIIAIAGAAILSSLPGGGL